MPTVYELRQAVDIVAFHVVCLNSLSALCISLSHGLQSDWIEYVVRFEYYVAEFCSCFYFNYFYHLCAFAKMKYRNDYK